MLDLDAEELIQGNEARHETRKGRCGLVAALGCRCCSCSEVFRHGIEIRLLGYAVRAGGGSELTTIYLKVHRYRWWVGLWSDSDGSTWLEIPNVMVHYYPQIKVVAEDHLQISEGHGDLKGTLSTLSNALKLSTPVGIFDGACKALPVVRRGAAEGHIG